MVKEICAEMALTRPEAFDEYVIFLVTNRGELPGGSNPLGSCPTWPPGFRPEATFSQKPLDPRVEGPFCAPSTPALGLSLSAPPCVRLSCRPDWDLVEEKAL